MKKKKSYQELLKEYAMTQNKDEMKAMEWYVEFFLNGLLAQRRERILRQKIDQALERRDKESFIKFSEELNKLIGK